jgi:hypothetical protein
VRAESSIHRSKIFSTGGVLLLLLVSGLINAQPSPELNPEMTTIKVHFLYGSRPLKKFKDSEKKWFGGILGGHVGIEGDSGRILNFRSQGNFHVFRHKKNRHSRYDEHQFNAFYAYFGSHPDSVKRTIVTIPVTVDQKQKFDSIGSAYLNEVPYDYALLGMRCGAAAYEILGQLGVVKNLPYHKTYLTIFYPQLLRKRLLDMARQNNWKVETRQGSNRRKWEKD